LLTLLGHFERRNIETEETSGHTYKVRVGAPDGNSTLHVSLNHETTRPGELIEIYARMGKPGAVESGLFEAVGRLSSAFLRYAAEFGEDERTKVEETIIHQLVNIQSGYPAWFKFSDAEKPVVVQSPCDGLAKAIQHYRRVHSKPAETRVIENLAQAVSHQQPAMTIEASNTELTGSARSLATCSKCGAGDWLKIDGCMVCQGCGFSKCG